VTLTITSNSRLLLLSTLLTCCIGAVSSSAIAQSTNSVEQEVGVSDTECNLLHDDATIDEQTVAKRLACHQRSTERMEWLVRQLQTERSILTSQLREDDPQLLEYKQKLIENQRNVKRLEQRMTDLATLSEALRHQRDDYRNRLLNAISESESRDQSRQIDDRLFRNFSQSYVTLSNENTSLRKQLDEQKKNITDSQSQISEQQSTIQRLQDDLADSENQIEQTTLSSQKVSEDLEVKISQLQTIKKKLLDRSLIEQRQEEQLIQLKRELALQIEAQQQSHEEQQQLNEDHALRVNIYQQKIQSLTSDTRTLEEAINKERAQREAQVNEANDMRLNLNTEKKQLEERLEQSKAQLVLAEEQQTRLMSENEDSSREIQRLGLSNADLQQQIDEVQEQLNEDSLQVDNYQQQIQSLTKVTRTLEEAISKERAQREVQAKEANDMRLNLNAEKKQLEDRLEQSKAQLVVAGEQQTRLMRENEDSSRELQKLDESNTDLQQQFDKVQEQNASLHTELDETREQLRLATDNSKDLNNKLQITQQTFSALKADADKALERFEATTLSRNLAIQTLEEKNAQLKADSKQFAAKAEEQQSVLSDELARSNDALDANQQDHAEYYRQFETTLARLDKQLLSKDQDIAELKAQQLQLNNQIESEQAGQTELNDRLRAQDQNILELEAETTQLTEELANATSLADDYSNRLTAQSASSTEQIALLEENVKESELSIEELNAVVHQLQQDLSTATDKLSTESEALAIAENSRLQDEKNNEEVLNRLNAQALESQQEITQLEEQLALSDNKYLQSKQKLDQLNSVQTTNEKLTAELSAIQLQLDNQISTNETLSVKLEERETLVADTESRLAKSLAETEKLSAAIAQKGEELNTKQDRINQVESALSVADQERSSLTEQMVVLDGNLSDVRDLLRESQNNSESVASNLEKMREELRASDKRLADRKNALAALIKEKQAITSALAEHQKESTLLAEQIKSKLVADGLTDAQVELQSDQTIAIKVGSSSLFRAGSSLLTEEGSDVLISVGRSISDLDGRRIIVEGHSDNTPLGAKLEETFVDNWGLSMARAVSTADFLSRSAGVPPNLLSVSGLGDSDPVADNSTVEGRQLNRRVEILLVDSEGS